MKNSLNHLPQLKQEELTKIVETIRNSCNDVEKIILYGSYARGDYKEEKDLAPNRKSGNISDYDILVITSKKHTALDTPFWSRISESCQNLHLSAIPRILIIDIEAINIKLAEAQYFYSDIKKEGILLFDNAKFELAEERNLSNLERKRIAQDYYDEWFLGAEEFFAGYEFYFNRASLKKAAFLLHQAAESSYKAVLLVYSNRCPSEHFLEFLGKNAEQYHKLMCNIFSRISKEDEYRFKLLEYAYIGGRYDPNYKITEKDLNILAADVKKLLELSKKVCEEKIKSFE
jgi:HEPN domain-containing protein/predicted nucleotidyltransferase